MKKIFLFLLISLSCLSCRRFLDTTPTDIISPAQFYNTEAELNDGLTGVYDVMSRELTYGMNYQFYLTLGTDITYMTGNQASGSINTYQGNSGNNYVRDFWRFMYFGIDRANNLLANINKPSMDNLRRGHIEGEARFLRAYYYFLLVTNFGDVPLKLTPTASVDSVHIPRTASKEVYEYIVDDMKKAYSLLDKQTVTTLGFSGRVSKTAVAGILARVYLHMAGFPLRDVAKYEDALYWAKQVISSGEHEINPDYRQIFINYAQDKYDTKESIWEVEFWGNRNGNDFIETGRIGNYSGITARDPQIGNCSCLGYITGWLFDMYEVYPGTAGTNKLSPDIRREWNNAQYSYGTAATNPTKTKTNVTDKWAMGMGKFRREYELVQPKHVNYTPQNFPLLRYSDVLLMFAEASNELYGPTPEAIEAVNKIRRRGYGKSILGETLKSISVQTGGTGYTSAPTVTISGGGGTLGKATASISQGRVSAISITELGQNYTSNPVVTITGGGGSGATATSTISQLNEADLKAGDIASKDNFRTALQKERALELVGEALRKGDLIRWGILISELRKSADYVEQFAREGRKFTSQTGLNVSERDVLLPIPQYDINLNKALVQNPGW